ncbi:HDOD domain-containing protein [Massilia sp. DD77]|uniref:HDOD domain-containing protein n=1 Tax=Massilia sp. DD77 TaxID=3109349 RepID=UPI002FFFB5CB
MKKWIGRLLGGSEKETPVPEAPEQEQDEAQQDPELGALSREVDATYYRWLTAAAGYDASKELQHRILDGVRMLVHDPDSAAELVPRVPELIPKLMRSLMDENLSATELSRELAQDPVLVAEVIRESNSAYYRPLTPIKTLEAAVMMLGLNGVRMLLARIGLRPLVRMEVDGFARHALPIVWDQSEKCAFAASMLAPGMSASVFEAYLAGLMQNVGLIVAFRMAGRHCEGGRMPGSSEFGLRLLNISRQLSAVIAAHWDFPPQVAEAIVHAGRPSTPLAEALAHGDRVAKLRLLIDAEVIPADDPFVTSGLDNFQRRCLGKLGDLDD